MAREIVQVRRLRDAAAFDAHLQDLGIELARHPDPAAVLGRAVDVAGATLANRWAVLPMEGWDGTADGRPTDLVRRRWRRFGESGAALVWGGEAVAVRSDGRANPRQLAIGPASPGDLATLREELVAGHAGATGGGAPPVVGLQLTHSGRWSCPDGAPAPCVAFRHPLLDARVGATDSDVVTDGWLDDLVGAYAAAAKVASDAGFDFVDVKHCHGYLLHELLAARDRPGRYGGDLPGRTRFLTETVGAIRRAAPGLGIGVRLSAFDVVPHVRGGDGRGVPEAPGPYPYAFGGDGTGMGIDLGEVHELCEQLVALDVTLLCVTAGSPYWCPHVQRPAYFPPSDGYLPPRDPLLEVARLLDVTAAITRAHPRLTVVASGLSYLQEWMPGVAAAIVDRGAATLVGYGRGVLSYPELPRDVLGRRDATRGRLCRTFSDCTTAPRNGLVSGCYPLDPFYKARPERLELTAAKRAAGEG
ncbi:MAG TPA: NADH:flavin oxidoreductase [Acidimicrobiia bacterium]|jgi:2,4-dienoyl-CoA reductase-like NADH-dependent reductase (Old Yellow Enzyme family)